jgi:hypothetical protein
MDKFYDKHYVKKNPATGDILIEDGNPVLGEIAKKGCPLPEKYVKVLNRSWKNTGIFFAEVKKEAKTDARLALEKEATELDIKFRDNIGDDKLQEKINKAIEE